MGVSIMQQYLVSFLIGGNPVSALLFRQVKHYKRRTFDFDTYISLVPLYFGALSVLARAIREVFDLDLRVSLVVTNIISVLFIILLTRLRKSFTFDTERDWWVQHARMAVAHTLMFQVVIFLLEDLLGKE